MKLRAAILILMECAQRDVRGSGMGYRATTDEWRAKVEEAWTVAFRRVHRRDPGDNEYFNAGMSRPNAPRQPEPASGDRLDGDVRGGGDR